MDNHSVDTLNMLLVDDNEDGPQKESSDWLWSYQTENTKPYGEMMDFGLPLDMDFNSLDPSVLSIPPYGYDDSLQYPFTFQSAMNAAEPFTKERRSSVTSSSSSSAASFSPGPESVPSPVGDTKEDPVAQLAQRVRESAGVLMAVPTDPNLNAPGATPESHSKLPIPRLPRHNAKSSASSSASSSAASTPPPSTPPPSTSSTASSPSFKHSPSPPVQAPIPPAGPQPRPKTSHTTIERRYRTNLNARIQSLRMAVPALRVLEDRDGSNGKKIKKNLKGGVLLKGAGIGIVDGEDGTMDVIDERGFVDGVKVARKCSKANVLGKAVEYIRVLKRREARLKAEQAGLKALVEGLVGGPALVKEWEREWRAKFGGEERDEVEGEEDDADDDESDEEDGDDDDEAGRKRKRPKSSTTAKKTSDKDKKKNALPPVVLLSGEQHLAPAVVPGGVPEKRKRGRPRKVLPPAVTLVPVGGTSPSNQSPADTVMSDGSSPNGFTAQWTQNQPPAQQYMLAVFALFSFFNSPLTSSSQSGAHHHTGVVLTNPPLVYAPEIVSQFAPPVASAARHTVMGMTVAWKDYLHILNLAVSLLVLVTLVAGWAGIRNPLANLKKESSKAKDWASYATSRVLSGSSSSLTASERFQAYRSLKSQPTAANLATLAFLLWSTPGTLGRIAKMKARTLWNRARAQSHSVSSTNERLVLDSMDLDAAVSRLQALQPQPSDNVSPLTFLARDVVKERVKYHLAALFTHNVRRDDQDNDAESDKDHDEGREAAEYRTTIRAAQELGGESSELAKTFESLWLGKRSSSTGSSSESESDWDSEFDSEDSTVDGQQDDDDVSEDEDDSMSAQDQDLHALITALTLYKRVFPSVDEEDLSSSGSTVTSPIFTPKDTAATIATSTLLSPPPSPLSTSPSSLRRRRLDRKRAFMLTRLRRVLGSRVFETQEGGLEDAKDWVVDRVVDLERRERIGASL